MSDVPLQDQPLQEITQSDLAIDLERLYSWNLAGTHEAGVIRRWMRLRSGQKLSEKLFPKFRSTALANSPIGVYSISTRVMDVIAQQREPATSGKEIVR